MIQNQEMSYEEIVIAWAEEINGHEILSDRDSQLLSDFERSHGHNPYINLRPIFCRTTTGHNRGHIMPASMPGISQCLEYAFHRGFSLTMSPMKNCESLNGSYFQVVIAQPTYAEVDENSIKDITSLIGLCKHDDAVTSLLAEALIVHNRKRHNKDSISILCVCGHLRKDHPQHPGPGQMFMGCDFNDCECEIFEPVEK